MMSKDDSIKWLQKRTEEYRSGKSDMRETIEDFDDMEKLGQGFSSADPLEEIDIGDGGIARPTFINANMEADQKSKVCALLKEFVDCFAWNYTEMPGLSRDLVEHRLPIKSGFRPHKQPRRNFNSDIYDRIKEEIDRLIKAGFIRPCRYADWISNIVPVEKKIPVKLEFA
jgi:hypothetical protein